MTDAWESSEKAQVGRRFVTRHRRRGSREPLRGWSLDLEPERMELYPGSVTALHQVVGIPGPQFSLCHVDNDTHLTGLVYRSHKTKQLKCSWHMARLSNMYVPLWDVGEGSSLGGPRAEAGKAGAEMGPGTPA